MRVRGSNKSSLSFSLTPSSKTFHIFKARNWAVIHFNPSIPTTGPSKDIQDQEITPEQQPSPTTPFQSEDHDIEGVAHEVTLASIKEGMTLDPDLDMSAALLACTRKPSEQDLHNLVLAYTESMIKKQSDLITLNARLRQGIQKVERLNCTAEEKEHDQGVAKTHNGSQKRYQADNCTTRRNRGC